MRSPQAAAPAACAPSRQRHTVGPYREAMTEITDRAQELLAERIDAVRKLSESQRSASQVREAAETADREAAAAWSDAIQAGWTSTELRKLGLSQPATRRDGRPKASRTTKRTDQDSSPRSGKTTDE